MSLGSNAIILKSTLGMPLPAIMRLLNTDVKFLNERERAVRETLLLKLKRPGFGFSEVKNDALIRMPPPPEQPPSMSDKEVATLVKAGGFTIHNSIPDMRPGKEKSVYASPSATPTLRVDSTLLNSVLQGGPFYQKHKDTIRPILVACQAFFVSGGTQKALFTRLATGFASPVVSELPEWARTDELFEAFKHFLPWISSISTSLSQEGRKHTTYTPNITSSYGLPYPEYQKRDDILVGQQTINGLVLMYDQAQEITSSITKGETEFNKFINSPRGRAFAAVLIKNKVEMMERKNYDLKVRPYGAYSAPMAYLFSLLWSAYSDGVQKATPDNMSISLIGHSWIGGGATTILNIIKSVEPGESRICAYADDFFVVVRFLEGDYRLIFPDVSQMDASIGREVAEVARRYILHTLSALQPPENFPSDFRHILQVWRLLAFRPECLFPKGVTGQPTSDHLISGVPGTSRVDEIASALIAVTAYDEKVFLHVDDDEDLEVRLQTFAGIAKRLGFTFKPATLVPQAWEDGQEIVGPILGQSLVFHEQLQQYVPKPKVERCIASLIYPKVNVVKHLDRIAYSMIVALGVAISGGAVHEIVYDACAAVWQWGKGQGVIPDYSYLATDEVAGFEGVDYSQMVFSEDGTVKDFPPQKDILAMYSVDYNVPRVTAVSELPPDVLDELEARLAILNASTDWGDLTEAEEIEQKIQNPGLVSNATALPVKADVERHGLHVSFGETTHPPGKRPEDAEKRRAKDRKHEKVLEKKKEEKTQALKFDFGGKEKRRPARPQKSQAPQEEGSKPRSRVTETEREEAAEYQARAASGAASNTRKRFITKRIKTLESRLEEPSLAKGEFEAILKEIDEYDVELGRS